MTAAPWDAVTAAFDGELRAWEAYAAEARAWADDVRARADAGLAPTEAQIRVGGDVGAERLAEQTEWVAASAERIATRLRGQLAAGDVAGALLTALSPGPGAKGFDSRAPGFFHGPSEPGDLRPTWEVGDRERRETLREALVPDEAPAWALAERPAWARPLVRVLWSASWAWTAGPEAYAAHLAATGHAWAADG